VLATVAALQKEVKIGKFPYFEFVEINCLRLQTPGDACKICYVIDGTAYDI
jgi:hypothetical protein